MIWFALILATAAFVFRYLGRVPDIEKQAAFRSFSKLLAAAAALVTVFSFLTIVPAGHVGVPVIFGSVQNQSLTEGLNLINPFASVKEMTVRTETYTMSSVHNEGEVKGDDSIQSLSADGLMMPFDITVAYRVVGGDAP